MQYGYIQYMNFDIEIYGDGDRKPWEKKERENWGGGGGWGYGYAQWVFLYIYISSLWCIFFNSNLAVCLNCKFPKKNLKRNAHSCKHFVF